MSIKSDAFSFLKFIVEKKQTKSEEISKYFEFDRDRTLDALRYLEEKGLIHIEAKTLGGYWLMIRPTAEGIDTEEQINIKDNEKLLPKKDHPIAPIPTETLDQISRIERSINVLHSRDYRKVNYNASLYPLIIASFIAIGFTSSIEFVKRALPEKYTPILTAVFYFLILISIGITSKMFEKMRKNLDVGDYVALIKIDKNADFFSLITSIRKEIEKNDHQLSTFNPIFEGFVWHKLSFYLQSRKTNQDRKEEILKESFNKKLKSVSFDFDYVNRKGIVSSINIDITDLKAKIELDKGIDFKIADKILKDILGNSSLTLIEKSGWDH